MQKRTLEIGHIRIDVFFSSERFCGKILYGIADGEKILQTITDATDKGWAIALLSGLDWNAELSPWPAKRCFRGGEDFSGSGDKLLKLITDEILPSVEKELPVSVTYRGIFGYSLAGLFALYAFYQKDEFACAASVSGSLWYDGFISFMRSHPLQSTGCVYLSLGEAEEKTRNPRLCVIGECTRQAAEILRAQKQQVEFEMNVGNHFFAPDVRIEKSIRWLLMQ